MWSRSPGQSMGLNQSGRQWDWNWLMLHSHTTLLYSIVYTVLQTTIRWRDISIILCLAGWLALLLTIVPGSNNWKLATKTVSLGAPRQLWIVETVISYQHWRLGTLRVQSEVEIFSFPADWLAAIATTPRWDSFVSFEKLSVKDFHGWSGPDYQNIYLNCHNILSLKRELVKTSSVL